MKTRVAYFAGAAALVSIAFLALEGARGTHAAEEADVLRAKQIARAVAWMAGENVVRDADVATFVDNVAKGFDGVESIAVLKGTKFVAHSDPERSGERLDRDSLADKALYDTAKRLKATLDKNEEERTKNPKLARSPYPEIEVDRLKSETTVRAPVVVDDRFRAMTAVRMKANPPASGLPWTLVLAALLGVFVFAGITWKVEGVAAHVAGSLVLLAVVAAQVGLVTDHRDRERRSHVEDEATTLAKLWGAGWFEEANGEEKSAAVRAVDRSDYGEDRGRLVGVRSSTSGAIVESSNEPLALLGLEEVTAGPGITTFKKTYLSTDRDRGALTWWGVIFGALGMFVFNLGLAGRLYRGWRAAVDHRTAYAYMLPAGVGMLVLVFVPVTFGIVLGFMQRQYNELTFIGLGNFASILSDFDLSDPRNFYFTLIVTIWWTFANVTLHVIIGLFFALLLNDKMLKARGLFRVLLIIPWAVPNYITALIWKGMFHRQFGAINFALETMGFEPISWFQTFWPAFSANLATNVWLGFPFMMVVSLGALQSIPSDLYEAAIVDGASRWQRFRNITLPLLMPALVPAVIVGTVWTFNNFNIIYLVSEGQPNGATDILITEAFRWAFERDRWGYAAAYSTVIFGVLLLFSMTTNRITGATKGAFE